MSGSTYGATLHQPQPPRPPSPIHSTWHSAGYNAVQLQKQSQSRLFKANTLPQTPNLHRSINQLGLHLRLNRHTSSDPDVTQQRARTTERLAQTVADAAGASVGL